MKPKLFLTQGHDEYWSWEMRDRVEGWRDQGVHLAFLGANIGFYQARLESGGSSNSRSGSDNGAEPRIVVCYRSRDSDPVKNHLSTIMFHDIRPEIDMIGVAMVGDPFDAGMVVANALHWVFNGTGLSNGDVLPGLLGYEVDGMGAARGGNMSVVALFETPLITGVQKYRKVILSHSTIYTAASGANVFSSGSIYWS